MSLKNLFFFFFYKFQIFELIRQYFIPKPFK